MSITVNWLDNSDTIIRLEVSDPWTYHDVSHALDTIQEMTQNCETPVSVLSDMSQSKLSLKLDMGEFRRLSVHPLIKSHRMGRVHVGGIRVSIKTLVDMVSPFFPRLFSVVKLYSSTEQALADLAIYQTQINPHA